MLDELCNLRPLQMPSFLLISGEPVYFSAESQACHVIRQIKNILNIIRYKIEIGGNTLK